MESPELQALAIIISLVFGLLFGSFATMASYRIPRGEDLIIKPSHCPKCKHRLGFLDLFPVFSWLFNRGKCRHCGIKVHWRYPATELLMSSLFTIIYIKAGPTLLCLTLMCMVLFLVIMIVTSLEHKIIPDLIHILLIPVGFIYRYSTHSQWYEYFTGALLGLFIAFSLHFIFSIWKKKKCLDIGSLKFFAVAGIFLGPQGIVPFLLLSGAIGIVTSLIWKKLDKGLEFPFSPSLAASLFLCILFPEYTIEISYPTS
jgi:prepilin signal peptidase PulO-like enzyme (type II secretory pathway)